MGKAVGIQLWQRLKTLGRSPEALLAAAQRRSAMGRGDEAIRLARRAISRRPEDARLRKAWGDLLVRHGRKALAAEAYAAAITLNPDRVAAYRAYVALRREEGRLDQAQRFLTAVAAQAETSPLPLNYLGAVAYFAGRTEEAVRLWESVAERHPDFAPAHANLGWALQQQGKAEQALLQYKLAIELDPRGATGAYNNLGELYLSRGELETAIESFRLAAELNPEEAAVPLANLGYCLACLGRREEAVQAYEESLKKSPGLATQDVLMEVLTGLARLYLELHRLPEAQAAAEAALARFPRSADALAVLGRIHFQKGEHERAIALFRQAMAINPMTLRNLVLHRLMALAYYRMGHFDKATAEYKRANAWHPDGPFGPVQTAGGEEGSPEQVVADCRAKLMLCPDDAALRRQAAEALFQMGCLEEAVQEYRAALAASHDDPELLCRLGTVYYAGEEYLAASSCFTRAAELNPAYVPAHLGLGLLHLARGSVEAAIQKFRWTTSLDPGSAEAYNLLGNALRQKGDLGQAAAAYRQAIARRPGYAQAHNNLGLTYLELERPREAIEQFRAALRVFPDYVPALCQLGRAHLALGNAAEARAIWSQALAINPHNPVAQRLLAGVGEGIRQSAAGEEGGGDPGREG